MENKNEELIGEVKINLYKENKYSLNHKFKSSSAEVYFVLCMIDRVLIDVKDTDHKHSMATMSAKYMSNSRNEREELNRFFNKYKENIDSENKLVFGVSHKLYKHESQNGTKFRIETDYSLDKVENFDGKISISIMLYIIDLMKRFSVENQEFIADAYTSMLQEYLDTDFPTNKSLGIAPVKAIREVIKGMK